MKKCVCGEEMTPAEWKNQWVCHRCGRTKPMRTTVTNADRIRAMSDEELCDLLDEWWCMGANNDERLSYADERLAWLQQPAEEDDNGV